MKVGPAALRHFPPTVSYCATGDGAYAPPVRSWDRSPTTELRIAGLSEDAAGRDPIALFGRWLEDAKRSGILLPETMALATCDKEGHPAARMALLKAFDERGFVFYTNYVSRKSEELEENPNTAFLFHWPIVERQVRIEGAAERILAGESAAYFSTGARGSQLSAWASRQSAPLGHPKELQDRFRKYKDKYSGGEVPWQPPSLAHQQVEGGYLGPPSFVSSPPTSSR